MEQQVVKIPETTCFVCRRDPVTRSRLKRPCSRTIENDRKGGKFGRGLRRSSFEMTDLLEEICVHDQKEIKERLKRRQNWTWMTGKKYGTAVRENCSWFTTRPRPVKMKVTRSRLKCSECSMFSPKRNFQSGNQRAQPRHPLIIPLLQHAQRDQA